MARFVLALFLLAWPAAGAAQDATPIVLIVDGTHGRLSTAHLQRELELVLARPIVRPDDAAAEDADLALVVAFSRPHRWTIRLVGGAAPVTRTLDTGGPALTELAALVASALEEADPSSSDAVATLDDPFAGPPVSRVSIAFIGALVDPFAPALGPLRAVGTPDVVDPWR